MNLSPPASINGTQRGWGVLRPEPWHFADVFRQRNHAEQEAAQRGSDYVVRYGELQTGTDSFAWKPELQPAGLAR